jgi:predicted Zn finger-like uncharacterized protein
VIVECKSCHSRFRLDEARVPASGAKVRCSHCKTAFVVQRPGSTIGDRIDEVVAEATNPGYSRAPKATEDLTQRAAGAADRASGDASGSVFGEDEHWEFDDDAPPAASAAAAAAPTAAAPAAAKKGSLPPAAPVPQPAIAQAESSADEDLDALGSPADWDLLAGAAQREAKAAKFEAPAPATPAPVDTPKRVSQPERAPSIDIGAALAERAQTPSEPPSTALRDTLFGLAQSAIHGAAWIAASALCALGLALALLPPSIDAGPRAAHAIPATGGSDVFVHSIESAVAGTLSVVRGQLAPGAANQRVRVAWRDARGRTVASAIAGPPLADEQLRELGLARVQDAHALRGIELARGGAFEAAFGALPAGSESIAVAREVVVEPVPTAPPMPTSSDPAARPSSE